LRQAVIGSRALRLAAKQLVLDVFNDALGCRLSQNVSRSRTKAGSQSSITSALKLSAPNSL
jgi:hypothetical protein